MDLDDRLERMAKRVHRLQIQAKSQRIIIRNETAITKKIEEQLEAAKEAREIVRQVGEEMQREAHERIAGLVSRCLAAVFDDPYQLLIVLEKKRNRTEARPVLKRGELEVDPMNATGGGVVDVIAFALRLAALLLKHPPGRRILILDEPFKFVSADYLPRLRALLETLATELDFQFLIVTHIEELEMGHVVRIS